MGREGNRGMEMCLELLKQIQILSSAQCSAERNDRPLSRGELHKTTPDENQNEDHIYTVELS